MGAFQPKGDLAEWRKIYAYAKDRAADSIITYSTISTLLGREFPGGNRQPIARAAQELRQVDNKTLVSSPGKGYRIARANEHVAIAKTHQIRARNQVLKAVEVLDATDRGALNTAESLEHDRASLVAYQMRETLAKQEGDVKERAETGIPVVPGSEPRKRVEILEEKVGMLSERMQQLLDKLDLQVK